MSTIVIKVKAKKLKKGDSIPVLENKSQKIIEVNNGDTIKWKYQNNSEITILPDSPFNNDPNQPAPNGKGEAVAVVNGATAGQIRIISYNIKTADTDTELDPVIVIKEPNAFSFTINQR